MKRYKLYNALRVELATSMTPRIPCSRGCGGRSHGGVCRTCLVLALKESVPSVDWVTFAETLQASRLAIFDAEQVVFGRRG